MEKVFFDDKLMKSSRLTTCPSCDSESRVAVEEQESVCEDCGEQFLLDFEGSYPEEFVWHPGQKF